MRLSSACGLSAKSTTRAIRPFGFVSLIIPSSPRRAITSRTIFRVKPARSISHSLRPDRPFKKRYGISSQESRWGTSSTYGQIAKNIAQTRGLASMSAQAVGSAVGHNPISILVPCHRVVGSDGGLTGYAGGLDKKAALLRIEKVDVAEIDSGRHIGRSA